MNVKYHNYAEITCAGATRRYCNQMLGGLNRKFMSGKSITEYIVFGSGSHGQLEGVTALADMRGAIKSEECAHNYDISKGAVFIKKMIRLDSEYDGTEITEVAFSPNADGSDIINYISVDGQVKQTGNTVHQIEPPKNFRGGKITAIMPSALGAVVCARGKSADCYYFPFNFDRLLIRTPVTELLFATIKRRSFKYLSGRTIKLHINYI